MVDSPAFQEQLNGLIDLLTAVGIHDDVDHLDIRSASLALNNQGIGAPIVFPSDIPEAKALNDDQIEAMIRKLQQAKSPTPDLIETLEDYVEMTKGGAVGGRQREKKKKKPKAKNGTYQPKKQYNFVQAYQQQQEQPQEEEHFQQEAQEYFNDYEEEGQPQQQQQQQNDHDDFDEDEEDDSFDEDADYPMVGPGVSDDQSVVSDMTTPTVVSSMSINDEERYSDAIRSPFGGGSRGTAGGPPGSIQPKKKNLVGARPMPGLPMRVGPPIASVGNGGGGAAGGAAGGLNNSQHSAGGAAAKRRQTYQQTMTRLHQNPNGVTSAGPRANSRFSTSGGRGAGAGTGPAANNQDLFAEANSKRIPPRNLSGNHAEQDRPEAPPRTKSTGSNRLKGEHQQKTAGASGAKPKKKGVKKTTGEGKKKVGGNKTIDKTGFPADQETHSPNNKSRSSNDDGATNTKVKKKVVKKKVVKRPATGEGTKRAPTGSGKSSPRRPAS